MDDALIFVFRSPNIPFWQFICLLSPGTPVQCCSRPEETSKYWTLVWAAVESETRVARDHVHAGLRVGDSRVPLPTAVSSRGDTAAAPATAVPRRPTAATTDEVRPRTDLSRSRHDHFPCLSSRSKLIHRKEISQYHSMIGLLHSKYFPSLDIYFHSCYRLYFGVKNTIQPEFPLACIDNVYSIHNMWEGWLYTGHDI